MCCRRMRRSSVRETAPLADHYKQADLLVQVDGMGGVDEVTDRVMAALPHR